MRQVKTHTLRYIAPDSNPIWVFSFQDYGDHCRVRMDGPSEFTIELPTGYETYAKGYAFHKFHCHGSGEVRKMHIDVAREIYSVLLQKGFTKPEYSPHMENFQDEIEYTTF